MPIVNIIKRASNYILGTDDDDGDYGEKYANGDLFYEDNEVLFCKNNICVHPPAFARQESDILHYPGYLTVTTKTFIDQYNNAKRPTLLLTWIPNATLRKCPSTVENAIVHRQFSEELKQNRLFNHIKNGSLNGSAPSLTAPPNGGHVIAHNNTNPFLEPYYYNSPLADKKHLLLGNDDNCDAISCSSSSGKTSSLCNSGSAHSCRANDEDAVAVAAAAAAAAEDEDVFIISAAVEQQQLERRAELTQKVETEEDRELQREMQPLLTDENDAATPSPKSKLVTQQSVTSVNITIANPCIQNHDISPTESVHQQNEKFLRTHSVSSVDDGSPNWMTPELFAYKHNLAFPESATASPIVQRKAAAPLKCRRFSVDLSQMRSLRLFFNDENCTSGQLVIASRESQYKILHFHHGGLDHLAQVLHQWHCLLHNIKLAPGKFFNYIVKIE